MSHAELRDRLDDYVDGALDAAETRAVREHLAACAECRAEVDGLRALLDETRFLPRDVAPPRDLWAGIEARLEPRAPAAAAPDILPLRRRSGPPRWLLQAAAAVVLVAGTSLVTWTLAGRGRAVVAGDPEVLPPAVVQGAAPTVLASFAPAEADYRTAIGDLERLLAEQRGQMAPETAATLERNLAIIDAAIADSRAALERDPNSAALARMLAGMYDTKVQVLRQAVQL